MSMKDLSGVIKFKETYNWNTQEISNPLHKHNIFDINNSSLFKTNYTPNKQKQPFDLGVANNRVYDEAKYRPCPLGLTPGFIRPYHATQFEYNGSVHDFSNKQPYNLTYNQSLHQT